MRPQGARSEARAGPLRRRGDARPTNADQAEPAKGRKGDSPPPPPVRYASIAHPSPALTKPGLSVLLTRRRDGVLHRDIGDTERCERHQTGLAEPAKGREGDSPLPFQFVIPVSRTQALPLLNRGLSVLRRGWRGGVLRRDIRVPEAKRGRVPCRNKEDATSPKPKPKPKS